LCRNDSARHDKTSRRPTAAAESEISGPVRQKNRSSKAAKPATQTMLIENSKSLASIGS
jgi:hypothetical protein